ncbi:MAG: hypothetical protein MUD16_15415 [Desulfobacterales bacterium]|nr:hypothetical protein [Desulfobacterales bacterium]
MNFMGAAMSKSVRSIELVKSEAGAEETMERIIGDYVKKMNQDPANVLTFMQAEINSSKRYGDNVSALFITFDAGTGKESPYTGADEKEKRTLKVTIAAEGNDLTALLTRSRGANTPPLPF